MISRTTAATGSLSMIFSIAARRLHSRLAGATSHRSEWAATKQVHIGRKSWARLMDLRQARSLRNARLRPTRWENLAEPAPSTRLNLSVPTRRRHRATAKDRCFHFAHTTETNIGLLPVLRV